MKKKLIATLVAGAVLSTGLIGLTACGGGLSINKGEEVSEEDWGKAFTATMEAESCTVDSYAEIVFKAKGSSDFVKEELGVDSIDMSVTTTGEGTGYYDVKNNSYYAKSTSKVSVSGVPDSMKEEYENKEYVTEYYSVKENDTYYMAQYNGAAEEPKWEVQVSTFGNMSSPVYVLSQTFATEKDGTATALSALYSSFAYSGGVYTATLYRYDTEYKVSVSVKGGYIVGFSTEYSESEEDEGFSESESMKTVYNFSNYGSTTVSPSDAAKKAIEDYKAENN